MLKSKQAGRKSTLRRKKDGLRVCVAEASSSGTVNSLLDRTYFGARFTCGSFVATFVVDLLARL